MVRPFYCCCCRCTWFRFSLTFGIILVIFAIVLWTAFMPIFTASVVSQMMLTISSHGQLSLSSTLWSNPPANVTINFNFFNVTNTDQVQYYGAKPDLIEVGPFAVKETENKHDLKFSENGETVYYKNYKHYFYKPNASCRLCRQNPEMMLPNVAALGAVTNMLQSKECGSTCRLIVDIGLLLMGEYPFRKLKPLNVTFYGYDDPFLSFATSPFYQALGDIFNNGKPILPFKVPKMPNMAFFYGYNNSNDEYYVVETGKKNINSLGRIQSWAGSNILPSTWWTTQQARMINGTNSGSFAQFHLKPDSVIPFFLSFLCRSFTTVFSKYSTYKGVKTMDFVVPEENFDTVSSENIGFRYRNLEKIKYFPDWSPCPRTKKSSSNFTYCSNININCALEENLCHECCNGSYVDGTYLLPPGMYPLACFPGRNETIPFSTVVSAPYFSYSPEDVISSVSGFPRFDVKPATFKFTREPNFGLMMQLDLKLMISFPMFHTNEATIAARLPDLMMPMLWIDVHGELEEDLFNMVRLGLVLVPKIAKWVEIATLTLGMCILIACAVFWFKQRYSM